MPERGLSCGDGEPCGEGVAVCRPSGDVGCGGIVETGRRAM